MKYLDSFLEYLKDEKLLAANSCASYGRDLATLDEFFSKRGICSPVLIDESAAAQYIAFLKQSGRAQSSVSRAIAAIRSFYKYLISKELVAFNPFCGLAADKCEKKLPTILTSREVDLLLEQPDVSELKGCRDKAMLELLYASGMRVSELCNLNIDDVNLSMGFVRLGEDGERIVPLYQMAVASVEAYLKAARPSIVEDSADRALFLNVNGTRLTRQGFWKIIKKYKEQAKIEKQLTPQTLRHSFAAHLLENGADLKAISEMLGHCDVASTQVYTKLIKNKFKNVYTKFHPRAN